MELVRPFVVNPVRYPVFHVPDNHYHVPIDRMYMGQFPFSVSTAHGPYPPYRDVHTVALTRTHFSVNVPLMAPPISIAARLLYFSRSEATPIAVAPGVPDSRQAALQNGQDWVLPTRIDIDEFNAQEAARPPWPSHDEFDVIPSIQFDDCFQRLTDCRDPFSGARLAPYTIGSLTGDFSGRMLVRHFSLSLVQHADAAIHFQIPDASQNAQMLNTVEFLPGCPSMAIAPFYARLVEWQCVNPQKPVPEGGEGSRLWDEGIRNGWFPEVVFYIEGDTLRIAHRYTGGVMYCYERFVPGRPNSHNPETCTACQARKAAEEKLEVERAHRIRDDAIGDDIHAAELLSPSIASPSSPIAPLPPPVVSINLPRPEDPLDPRFIRAEIQSALGEGIHIERLIDAEMDAVDPRGDEETEAGSTEDGSVVADDTEDDYNPFENDSCAGIRDIIITGEASISMSLCMKTSLDNYLDCPTPRGSLA